MGEPQEQSQLKGLGGQISVGTLLSWSLVWGEVSAPLGEPCQLGQLRAAPSRNSLSLGRTCAQGGQAQHESTTLHSRAGPPASPAWGQGR